VPIVLAIVFSTARGAWLGALGIAVALAWIAGARRARLPLAALGVAALAAFLLRADLRAQVGNMFALGGANAPRVEIYRTNLDIIHDHPVLGLGFGRYQSAAKPYYAKHPGADRHSHAHNNYLHVAAEAGLLGLAAFALLYCTALWVGWGAIEQAPDRATWATAAGAWAGIIGFSIGGLTQYTFGDSEVAIAMWVAMALLMRCGDDAGRSR
jgi:O-antigen ligase